MYRLYIDEVGTDDILHVDDDNHRYLSLTGVAVRRHVARDILTPHFNSIKTEVFDHDPDEPLIFHRTDIVQRKRAFGVLNNPERRADFDRRLLHALSDTPYTVISALLDKRGMINQPRWRNQHPYHYLMEIMVEKYVRFLEREGATGDIMPEGRRGKKDVLLQKAFDDVLARGTYFVSAMRIQERIWSRTLKMRYKPDNIAGLQLCDLLAHPSHIYIRTRMKHSVTMGAFCKVVTELLVDRKYDRSAEGQIKGYGYKWLP